MINITNPDLDKIKIAENSCKNILIYYIGYMTFKDPQHVKIGSVNTLFLITNKINEYFEGSEL